MKEIRRILETLMSSTFNMLDLKCLRISPRMEKYKNVTVTQFRNKV